nr:protein kinase-like domain, concanavalin A-like lectin/glucanase domain protein [Tanacetum cinerariifolium]
MHDSLNSVEELHRLRKPQSSNEFHVYQLPYQRRASNQGNQKPIKATLPKYLSRSSLAEISKNPSSLKRVHFDDSIIILNKEDEVMKERSMKPSATEYRNHEMTVKDEKEVESEEEVEEETEEETEVEEEDNPEYFDTFPTMNELRLEPRRKPSDPKKNCNFVGRVRRLKVFVGNFTYECHFMVLEDTTSVIDHYLGSVVFEKPFVEATRLVYNIEEGAVVFERDKEKIV